MNWPATHQTREEGQTLAEARGEDIRARDLFRYYGGEGWQVGGGRSYPAVSMVTAFTPARTFGPVGLYYAPELSTPFRLGRSPGP